MNLESLGIRRGRLCETIITTYHEDGLPNAAPMGVSGLDGSDFFLKVHTDTDTFKNIRRSGSIVINIVYDPLVFLKCSLYGRNKGSKEVEWIETLKASVVDAPYLKEALAIVQAELKDFEVIENTDLFGHSSVAKMTFKAKAVDVFFPFPMAPNRGFYCVLELAIALSRGLTENIKGYLEIIEKTLSPDEAKRIVEVVKEYPP
jgi:hypothetical protein